MAEIRELIVALFFGMTIVLLFLKHREVLQAIEDFKSNLPRGGPRPPTHPSPVGDAALLRRKR